MRLLGSKDEKRAIEEARAEYHQLMNALAKADMSQSEKLVHEFSKGLAERCTASAAASSSRASLGVRHRLLPMSPRR